MKGICYEITPTLDSSAGYRENQSSKSHNRFTLGLKAYYPKLHLTLLMTVEFQASV